MPYQNKWWDFLGDLNKWTKSPPSDMLPADEFVLEVTFGFLHYEGSIAGFLEGPHVQFREHGDELYGRDQSPPWIIWDEIVRGQWLFDYAAEKKTALRVVVSESGKYEKEAE